MLFLSFRFVFFVFLLFWITMIHCKSTNYSLKGDFHTRALYSFNNTSFISVDFLCPILLTIKIILKSFKIRFAVIWLKVIIYFNWQILNRRKMKEHLKQEIIDHNFLVLQFALGISKDLEAIVRRDPRVMSRSPQMFANYDSVVQDLLSRTQNNSETTRSLQGKIQEHSERITTLERAAAASTTRPSDADGSLPDIDITRRITNLENKTADQEVLFAESNRTIVETSREVGMVKRQLDKVNRKAELNARWMQSVEHELTLRSVTVADLEEYVRQQEFSSYDGQLLWKITDFSRRKNEAVSGQKVSFYSPCFFTSRYGYKMCALIYLNGDGAGRGTHISVFFGVLPSHYDASLRWPFRQKVTFMLRDQDFVSHITDSFIPDPNSYSFQGCPMFCSLEELNRHAYVRNDVMSLKVIVDTTGL